MTIEVKSGENVYHVGIQLGKHLLNTEFTCDCKAMQFERVRYCKHINKVSVAMLDIDDIRKMYTDQPKAMVEWLEQRVNGR